MARDLHWVTDDNSWRSLRSAMTHQLMVPRTRLRTIGDRAFGVAGARVWNELPLLVISAPSLAVFKRNLKTHLFRQLYSSHWRQSRVCAVPLKLSGLHHVNLDVYNNNNNNNNNNKQINCSTALKYRYISSTYCVMRRRHNWRWPQVAAAWSGVHNSVSRESTIAPFSSNSFIMSAWLSIQHFIHTHVHIRTFILLLRSFMSYSCVL